MGTGDVARVCSRTPQTFLWTLGLVAEEEEEGVMAALGATGVRVVAPLRVPRRRAASGRSRRDGLGLAARARAAAGAAPGAPPASGADRIGLAKELVPDWEQVRLLHATALSSLVGKGLDHPARPALAVAARLSEDVTYELLDDAAVVDVFQNAYDGGLGDCATIVDTHVRLLADCLCKGGEDASLTAECYSKLDSMPPLMRRQVTTATAAVGAAALQALHDEQELMRSLLADDPETAETEACKEAAAYVAALDAVLAALPVPPPSAFEDDE